MAFRIPTLNLLVNVWTNSVIPPAGPPRLGNLPAQLARDEAGLIAASPGQPKFLMLIRVTKGTDLRGIISSTGTDLIECPAGTGIYYTCLSVADVARGFPNEYRVGLVSMVATGTPMP